MPLLRAIGVWNIPQIVAMAVKRVEFTSWQAIPGFVTPFEHFALV
jgi:hypothetical protein